MQQVPIIQIGNILLVTLHSEFTDDEAIELKNEILVKIQKYESQGLLIDISVVDMIDSFLGRILNEIVEMSRLMGAKTVVTGMSPQVAISMMELGLSLRNIHTALNVEVGLAWLNNVNKTGEIT